MNDVAALTDAQLVDAFVAGCNAENELNAHEMSPENVRRGVAAAMRGALGAALEAGPLPKITEANLAARLELVFEELMDGGPGGSCPYANVTDSARFAQVVAGLLWSYWDALRGVRGESLPPLP